MDNLHPKARREEIKKLQAELEAKVRELERIIKNCKHVWSEPKYVPEHHEAYTIPGDPPGTMGSDWRGPCEVPARTIKKWVRRCSECGTEQVTEKTELVGNADGLKKEVPDFKGAKHV